MNEEITILVEHIATFDDFHQWVNRASSWIGGFPPDEEIICIAANETVCTGGKDMMSARDNDLFPVKAYRLARTSEINPETKNEER